MNEVERLTAMVQWYTQQLQHRDLEICKLTVANGQLSEIAAQHQHCDAAPGPDAGTSEGKTVQSRLCATHWTEGGDV